MEKANQVGELWNDFSQNTGFHGFNKLSGLSQRNKLRVVIWILLIASCATYLIYLVIVELKSYYNYPTIMTMYATRHTQMTFPAITICNLNALNKSAMKNDSRIDDYYFNLSPMAFSKKNVINWTDPFYEIEGFFINRTLEDILNENKKLQDSFLYYSLFDMKVLDLKTHFMPVITYFGPCITSRPEQMLQTFQAGILFNLNMFINVDVANNYYGRWLGEGILFSLHDYHEDPFFGDITAYFVEPGHEVYAKIRKTQVEHLPHPYEAISGVYCRETPISGDGDDYAKSACLKDCISRYLYNACNCLNYSYKNTHYCSKYDEANCISNAVDKLYQNAEYIQSCDCRMACRSTQYDVSMTSATYPSDFSSNLIDKIFNVSNAVNYRKNYISLHVYFDQLMTTTTKQLPKYSSSGDIFANLGGQMGLFLGASIVTFTELVEFIVFTTWLFFKKMMKRTVQVEGVDPLQKLHMELQKN